MGFNSNTFFIVGTAIAIFGVGLYIYDTRKDKVVNAYNRYTNPSNDYSYIPKTNYYSTNAYPVNGGTRKHNKKNKHKKTNKNK